jgi:hypothetical protein
MKNLILALTMTLLAASMPQTGEGSRVRYRDLTPRMSLTMSQDIEVPKVEGIIASRTFSFDLTLATDHEAEEVTVTIDRARATYSAHGMKERLGTRHLTGRSFPLSISNDRRQLEQVEPSIAPVVNLDPIVAGGFPIAGLLADTLPVLPQEAVALGATWTTERPVRSLEGWAWGVGRLSNRHRVTAVDQRDGHSIVTVITEANTHLDPVKGERAYSGVLKRTLHWVFDATDGRLLSLSMDQETKGVCELPQGETQIRQLTRVELTPTMP